MAQYVQSDWKSISMKHQSQSSIFLARVCSLLCPVNGARMECMTGGPRGLSKEGTHPMEAD